MIQVRDVPDEIHRVVKARAAQAGMSLSEYLLREIKLVAKRPTLDEIMTRIKHRGHPIAPIDSAAELRAEREGRR
jgi:plasmid stability protein